MDSCRGGKGLSLHKDMCHEQFNSLLGKMGSKHEGGDPSLGQACCWAKGTVFEVDFVHGSRVQGNLGEEKAKGLGLGW